MRYPQISLPDFLSQQYEVCVYGSQVCHETTIRVRHFLHANGPYLGVTFAMKGALHGQQVWITREKLWINEANWGKLAILFQQAEFRHPHIWGWSGVLTQIFSRPVGWGFFHDFSVNHPQLDWGWFTLPSSLYLPYTMGYTPYIGDTRDLHRCFPHIHKTYYDYDNLLKNKLWIR